MPTVNDLNTPLSGYNYIDALLDQGPDWNFLTPAGNTLLYTFSVTAGNEDGRSGQQAFSAAQQGWVRYALAELQKITGITFTETASGDAQLHFCNIDITDNSYTTGLCSWHSTYGPDATGELKYDATAYIYLDNNEFYAQNRDLTPGLPGYQTLLHELGHALGLKHPFLQPDDPPGTIVLPDSQDNTANTLMAYTEAGGTYQHYNQYDIAALNWLYGGDGLRGALGINSTTGARYITGTNGNDVLTGTPYDDTLEGDGGNDQINGGDGTDTVVFKGSRSDYRISQLESGALVVAGSAYEGTDTLTSVEYLKFLGDNSVQRAQVAADTTPPAAPTLSVAKNANGYALGSTPLVTGMAEPNSTINLYYAGNVVGTAKVDANGLWSVTTAPFPDGLNLWAYATATDTAGNVSLHSDTIYFNIDGHAPDMPTGGIFLDPGSNRPTFVGSGESGTIIQLVRVTDGTEVARTTVGADGSWYINNAGPLPNGDFTLAVVSVDAADNATSSANRVTFSINSALNVNGDAGANTFKPGAGDNAIDGNAGLDTAVYAAPRANFIVKKEVWGYSVTDNVGNGGHDTLINVERVQFSDGKWLALDIDGAAGKVYRMYQAAFDRTPDAGGYAYWLNAMDHGYTLNQVSGLVLANKEAVDLYMKDPSDEYFVTQLYHHVLHREPEGAGYQWWLDNVHKASRAEVLAMFSESPENQAQVIGTIQNGIDYTPWTGA
ncbi:DUF4214 domain-containing protein [Massilia agilis]|uniref:DUF4214 domain-containing protein n=1 Tax=Massilia agilis TaxID=1811226 RepID=A0ABT2DGM6_9BURK|nr:DUF4214 domain-containing protein [Massilia agilis]MCS0810374.1 DUF4214 domain-containing protein [Massilia agilis]